MNLRPSEFKLSTLCAEKFATAEKIINHKLCMHTTAVIQMSFMQ